MGTTSGVGKGVRFHGWQTEVYRSVPGPMQLEATLHAVLHIDIKECLGSMHHSVLLTLIGSLHSFVHPVSKRSEPCLYNQCVKVLDSRRPLLWSL